MNKKDGAKSVQNPTGEVTENQNTADGKNKSKDKASRALLWYSDVFASVVNVLLCDGEQTVNPAELQNAKTFSVHGLDDELKEQARDVCKLWVRAGIKIALLGIEHQSVSDPRMVMRVMGYDSSSYIEQYDKAKKNQKKKKKNAKRKKKNYRYPVLTVALNFSLKRRGSPRWLHEYLAKTPEKIKQACGPLWKLLPDYGPLHVIDMAFLSDRQIELLHPDLRAVALSLRGKRLHGEPIMSDHSLVHFMETARLLALLSWKRKKKRKKYLERVSDIAARKNNKEITMIDLFAASEERGREQGYEMARVDLDAANLRAAQMQKERDAAKKSADAANKRADDLEQKLNEYISRFGDLPQ